VQQRDDLSVFDPQPCDLSSNSSERDAHASRTDLWSPGKFSSSKFKPWQVPSPGGNVCLSRARLPTKPPAPA
jgi:hypothetical protein